jgi:hypothetical protein
MQVLSHDFHVPLKILGRSMKIRPSAASCCDLHQDHVVLFLLERGIDLQ